MSGPPPPYTWRAGSGYVPPPYASNPANGYVTYQTMPPPPSPMYVNNNHQYFYPPGVPTLLQYQLPIGQATASAPAKKEEPKTQESKKPEPKKEAPKKKEEPKKKEAPKKASPPPPPPPASTVVSASSTAVSSAASTQVSSASTKVHKNPNAPPPLRSGTNYMFPPLHTRLQIFDLAASVWLPKYHGIKFDFRIFTVPTMFTPQMVIENVLEKPAGDGCKGWAVTEVFEKGDGKWAKGSTIEYTSDKAKSSLAAMGWTERRGENLPPVWLTVKKL